MMKKIFKLNDKDVTFYLHTCAQRVRLVSSEILVSSAFILCPCLRGLCRDSS